MTYAELQKMIAESVAMALKTGAVPPPVKPASKPASDRMAAARAAKAAKAAERRKVAEQAKPAKPAKAAAKPAAESVECGGIEFRKGSETKAGREYVLIYVGGTYAGSLRVDDGKLLAAVLKGVAHKDAADAIALACE
ncbi:MAG: hypothetical protein EBR88_00005 [Betaproteobacteria bacterium]|nr:hypothetical protein [Betaproteobacteria bacterium]